jgi:hypothetical protein
VFDHLGIGEFDLDGNRIETREYRQHYYIKIAMKNRRSGTVLVELTRPDPEDMETYEFITGKDLF